MVLFPHRPQVEIGSINKEHEKSETSNRPLVFGLLAGFPGIWGIVWGYHHVGRPFGKTFASQPTATIPACAEFYPARPVPAFYHGSRTPHFDFWPARPPKVGLDRSTVPLERASLGLDGNPHAVCDPCDLARFSKYVDWFHRPHSVRHCHKWFIDPAGSPMAVRENTLSKPYPIRVSRGRLKDCSLNSLGVTPDHFLKAFLNTLGSEKPNRYVICSTE